MSPHIFLLVDDNFTDAQRILAEMRLHSDQFPERQGSNIVHVCAPTSTVTMAHLLHPKTLELGYHWNLLTHDETLLSDEERKRINRHHMEYLHFNGYSDRCRFFCFVADSRNLHPVIAATVETAKKFNIPLQIFE